MDHYQERLTETSSVEEERTLVPSVQFEDEREQVDPDETVKQGLGRECRTEVSHRNREWIC